MAIGSLPPVINEIQANSGQPGKTLAQQTSTGSLLDVQAAATAEPTNAIVPETTLLERAVAEALGRQGGLASLYATLTELAKAPDLPDAVKAAVNTLLAFRLDESDVTAERVAQAIRSSGVFHEAVAAGKMAAALPAAVRQALGGTPEQRVQAAARPMVSSPAPAPSNAVARPAASYPQPSPDSYTPPTNPGTSAAAAQAYGRQAGTPLQSATQAAPQTTSPAAVVNSSATPTSLETEINTAPRAGSAAQPTGPTIQTAAASSLSSSAPLAAQTIVTGEEPAVSTPAASSSRGGLPIASNATEDASVSVQQQMSPSKVDETSPAFSTIGGAAAPKISPSVVSGTSAGVTQNSQIPSPSPTVPPPDGANALPILRSAQPSDAPDVEAPTQQPLAASPSNGAPTARSFAPWTPGRPMTTAASQASLETPGALLSPSALPASSSSTTALPVGETVVARPSADRALFVPSAVDSLPNAASGTAAQKIPAGAVPSVAMPNAAPHQSGPVADPVTSQSSNVPLPTISSAQTSSEPSQLTSPQVRAATPPSAEVPPLPAPPTVSQAALSTTIPPLTPGLDLKGAIDLLRRELITWLGRNADVMASLDGASDDGSAPRVDSPQPPRKGGPVRGQPAVTLLGGDEADPTSTEALAGRALGEAERSLSRVFLHQAATAESRDSKTAQVAQAFVLEIPIAGPNGTSIAQLRIERDDHAPSEAGAPPRRVFQVDIAFDIVPLGPVAVRVGLMDGRRVAVGVWCESDDGLVRMEAERENIVLGLEQEGMVVAGVDLHRGHPPEGHDEAVAAPSHRLDLQL